DRCPPPVIEPAPSSRAILLFSVQSALKPTHARSAFDIALPVNEFPVSSPPLPRMTQIAFLGLGAIGTPMARHLAQPPFTLTVWNRTRARADEFARSTGARAAATPRDAATGAVFVVTCLPTSREVESLLDGADGLIAGMASGSMLIDCTSGDPATSRRIAARLGERGIGFVDAPVSGGTVGAERGTLTVMCGGDAESF